MAKAGSTAREINQAIALEHREQSDRPQMHAAEREELAKYYGIRIDGRQIVNSALGSFWDVAGDRGSHE